MLHLPTVIALSLGAMGMQAAELKQAPLVRSFKDLEALNGKLVGIGEHCMKATVSLIAKGGGAAGSGVVVSEDGLILTAAHVADAMNGEVFVLFPDGRKRMGKILGRDFDRDAAMVQIVEKGEYPFVELAGKRPLRINQWCVATGHPGGFDPERTPPLRLGRVLSVDSFIRTDCTVVGGDSGGPLFNLNGKLIGIHSNIQASLSENHHVPISVFQDEWESLKSGKVSGTRFKSKSPDKAAAQKPGEKNDEDADQPQVTEEMRGRLKEMIEKSFKNGGKLMLNKDDVIKFGGPEALRKTIQKIVREAGPEFYAEMRSKMQEAPKVEDPFYTAILDALEPAIVKASESTFAVKADGKVVALGTAVDADGWIITKNEETRKGGLSVSIHGKDEVAEVIKRFPSRDLVLLRVGVKDLHPVEWLGGGEKLPLGSMISAPSANGKPLGIGVIGVLERSFEDVSFVGVLSEKAEDGIRVRSVMPNSPAGKAGLLKGDVIVSTDAQKIVDLAEFSKMIRSKKPGDELALEVKRGDEEMEIHLGIGTRPRITANGELAKMNLMSGAMSSKKSGYPEALQHDIPLEPSSCGGPLVDLDGRCVGINVSRAGRVATLAVPADDVMSLIAPAIKDAPARKIQSSRDKERESLLRLVEGMEKDLQELKTRLGALEAAEQSP